MPNFQDLGAKGLIDTATPFPVPNLQDLGAKGLIDSWIHLLPCAGGVMQPQMKKKKTVTTPKTKHLRSKQVDRYCLQHQEEDSEGDVKTELYKVDLWCQSSSRGRERESSASYNVPPSPVG